MTRISSSGRTHGLGAVLLQMYDGLCFPVAFAGKKLTSAQTSYATVEKECTPIVWAIEKFNLYLYGRKFTLQSDHQPLAYVSSAKMTNHRLMTNPRLMHWVLKLQPYRYSVETISGNENVGADYLSWLDWAEQTTTCFYLNNNVLLGTQM